MTIKSIRLLNFKGFKDSEPLKLKPLTVLLGPNSAGKSCFGQALVALSKSNEREGVLNLHFGKNSSIEFGSYPELVHEGCEGEPVKIELEFSSGSICFGFGGSVAEKRYVQIKPLDLTSLNIKKSQLPAKNIKYAIVHSNKSHEIDIPDAGVNYTIDDIVFNRDNKTNWTYSSNKDREKYKVNFNGVIIEGFTHVSETAVATEKVIPDKQIFLDANSFLEKVEYLRPDREKPKREYETSPLYDETAFKIDDWGRGAPLYLYSYGDDKFVDTFLYPPFSSDQDKAQQTREEIKNLGTKKLSLQEAVIEWLNRLGLAKSYQTKLIKKGTAIQSLVTIKNAQRAKPLTDVGFGVSQVIPILAKGLLVEKNGMFVVEQPEAQLHPKSQAELANFFCSMVRCGRNVLLETHSEALFHRLRILFNMDDELAGKMAVYFIDEAKDGQNGEQFCCVPRSISLSEGDEFDWPIGFLSDGVETEMRVRAARIAKRKEDDNC